MGALGGILQTMKFHKSLKWYDFEKFFDQSFARSFSIPTDILKRTNATTIGIIYLFFAICNIINFFVLLISNKCLALLISDKCLLQNRHNITIGASEQVLIAHDHMLNLFRDFQRALSKVKIWEIAFLDCPNLHYFDDYLSFTLSWFVSVCKIIWQKCFSNLACWKQCIN